MPYIAIINRSTHAIETLYEGTVSNQSAYGGPWGWPRATVHLPIPETLNKELVRVTLDEMGGYVFEIDPIKEQVANAGKWDALRAERNLRLTNSDWTQLSDIPSSINKDEWAVYRQVLRDITNTTTDINNIVWPIVPGSIVVTDESIVAPDVSIVGDIATEEPIVVTEDVSIAATDEPIVVVESVVADNTNDEIATEEPIVVTEDVSIAATDEPIVVTEEVSIVGDIATDVSIAATDEPIVVLESVVADNTNDEIVTDEPIVVTDEVSIVVTDVSIVGDIVTEEPIVVSDIVTEETVIVIEETVVAIEEPIVVVESIVINTANDEIVTEESVVVPDIVTEESVVADNTNEETVVTAT